MAGSKPMSKNKMMYCTVEQRTQATHEVFCKP